jgi:hypothetical protein
VFFPVCGIISVFSFFIAWFNLYYLFIASHTVNTIGKFKNYIYNAAPLLLYDYYLHFFKLNLWFYATVYTVILLQSYILIIKNEK